MGRRVLSASGGGGAAAFFVAAGARVLGFSRQIVRALGGRPYVYRGGAGPRPCRPRPGSRLRMPCEAEPGAGPGRAQWHRLRAGCGGGSRGCWNSIRGRPRPSSAFDDAIEGGLMRAHVEACAGRLPVSVSAPASSPVCGSATPGLDRDEHVRGFETVFARRAGAGGRGERGLAGRAGLVLRHPARWHAPCVGRSGVHHARAGRIGRGGAAAIERTPAQGDAAPQPRAENPTACR